MTCVVVLQSADLQTYQIQAFTTTARSGQQYDFFTPGHVGAASQGYAPVWKFFEASLSASLCRAGNRVLCA